MRILHVYKDYAPVVGGIENHVKALAEGQAAAGHAVTVLVTHAALRTRRGREVGVRVVRAGRLVTIASTPISAALPLALRAERPDITHLHAPYPVGEAAWLAFGRPAMVLSYHSDVVRQRRLGALWAPGQRAVLRRADAIIAGSPRLPETSPMLAPYRAAIHVVPYGIDTGRFDLDAAARAVARARWRPSGDGPVLAFVGRLRYYKGLDIAIEALALLPAVRLLVVGTGPMGAEWRALAEARGVAERVVWLGDVPDQALPAVLVAADAYVLPASARSEAFGIAMVEGMAAGLPVISTELGTGTSWVNQDGQTGAVVAPRDPYALAEGIRVVVGDEERRAALGRAAEERARAEFDAGVMGQRVASVYQAALARRHPEAK